MVLRRASPRSILVLFVIWNVASRYTKAFFVPNSAEYPIFTARLGASVDDNLEASLPVTEQQHLRFSGVGRLYTSSESEDEVLEHLEVVERLSKATVLVVGLGGVGSWAAEAICRSGVGKSILIDLDDICISNTNRQLHATSSTVGKMKIDQMKKRLHDINPYCEIELIHDFVSPENVDSILKSRSNITACLDAIDGTRGKASLIAACARYGIPIVTCGGSAGRTDPTKFVCEDLTRVYGDPLLSACRKTLRQQYGFDEGASISETKTKKKRAVRKWKIKAVFSTELQKSLPNGSDASSLRRCDGALGTACFVTGTCGFVAAGELISQIANDTPLIPKKRRGNIERHDDSYLYSQHEDIDVLYKKEL